MSDSVANPNRSESSTVTTHAPSRWRPRRTGATAIAATTAIGLVAGGVLAAAPVQANVARIHDIQGRSHVSPLVGKAVTGVAGVVTAVSRNGFWMQDQQPDTDPATSEGILVFTGGKPTVSAGDAVTVSATVTEYRPGDEPTNLSTTELTKPTVTVTAGGQKPPAATLVGPGGRLAPPAIRVDSPGDVEKPEANTANRFNPRRNALDFYESTEGMLIQLRSARAVGPTSSFGEIPVLPGSIGSPPTERGGVRYTYQDPNSERVMLDDTLAKLPTVNVRDRLVGPNGPVEAVMDYSFGNFKALVTATPRAVSVTPPRETARPAGNGEITAATFNVENLAPADPAAKYTRLAQTIVTHLAAPDLLAIEEIQDDNGTGSGVVTAGKTWAKLVAAITAAGGPTYQWRQIDPADNQDGGAPGGNIRQGFLFRTDRGLGFTDRPGATATTANEVRQVTGKPALRFSPGRIDPGDDAFGKSRKPLAAEFTHRGRPLFVVANHFNSKGGDQPLFGRFQPPTRGSESQRHAQASAVRAFTDQVTRWDRNAAIVVLGDINDFEFSRTTDILTARGGLIDLPRTLPASERYTYNFNGNSQVLDHILVSRGIKIPAGGYDIVHVNSEYADQVSDHDPQLVRFR